MPQRSAIVTGGLRGLGLAMSRGLIDAGWAVLAVGHIEADLDPFRQSVNDAACAEALIADLRVPAECDRVFATAVRRFGSVDCLVNNAGLTFTYTDPDRFSRGYPLPFWDIGDDISRNVIETNYLAAEQMARRAARVMRAGGWGRIINVTTKLDTMNALGATPYGPSKAALEMATEVWAKELAKSSVTVNILNPGFGANTPGISSILRERSRRGEFPPLVQPEAMIAPLLWLTSPDADAITGWRVDANQWNTNLPPREAALRAGRPAGMTLHGPVEALPGADEPGR